MSSWGNYDNVANAPLWSTTQAYIRPTTANVTLLYGNTTADAFITNETLGLFAVDSNEIVVDSSKVAHTGWVLRTTKTVGGVARTMEEVLVATGIASDNNSDDAVYPDTVITIDTAPQTTRLITSPGSNTFTVVATSNPSVTLAYQWQVYSGGSWLSVANNTPANTLYTGGTTATLNVAVTGTDANNYNYRVVVSAAGTGASVTSANGSLLVS